MFARTRRLIRCTGIAAAALGAMAAASASALTVLFVTENNGSYTAEETLRKNQFQTWGHTVTPIWDAASQATFDTAMASADLVYVSEESSAADTAYKLRFATIGVVLEDPFLDLEMGLATSDGATTSQTQINIVDTTYGSGLVAIFSSSQPETYLQGTAASGFHTAAQTPGGQKSIGTIEGGSPLADTYNGNSTAAGRRLRLPWGGDTFSFASVNATGLTLLQMSLAWAAEKPLLLHWKLDEASGTSAADSSTYAHTGTVTGSASWIAARRKNGFDFNGATKIEVNSLLNNPKNFTVACWARIDATDTQGAEGVSLGDYISLRPHQVTGGGPAIAFFRGSSTWVSLQSASSYVGRGWHHYAATFDDDANSLKLYIDGVNVASTTTTFSITWSGLGSVTRVGTHGNTNTSMDMDGAIDDVRVYQKILTPSEIVDLYGLVGQWKLTETSGTAAADSSGKALDGTYTSGPLVAQAGPYPGAGQYSASFDGVNDYVNGATSTNYSFADGFSIAAWVNLDTYLNNAGILQVGSTTDACGLAISATGQVKVTGRSSGGVQTLTTTATLPTGKWRFVVGTYDGATLKVYIDGQLVSSANNAFTVAASAGNLTIAASLEGTDEYLDGRVHGARLYNRAIAADEVAELFGLVSRWKLDETSGTAAADSSGLGLTGAYTNGPTLAVAGAYDYAMTADGSDDYVTTAEALALRVTDGVAMSAWIWPVSSANATRMIVNKEGEYELGLTATGEVEWALANTTPGWAWHATGALVPNNRWSHIVVSYEGGVVKTYVNGQLKETFSGSGNVGDANVPLNDLRIGGRSNNPAGQYFAGRIDEVRIYNRPLSTLEVAELSGLWGHWKFDEGAGTTIADATLNGNTASFNAGSPNWVSGIYNYALEFDGPSDDAITANQFSPPSEGTVAFWFRSDGPPASRQRLWGLGGDFEAWQDPDGFVSCDVATDGFQGGCITTTPLYTAGRWYHLVIVFDSDDDSYKIYLNGELHKSGISSWGTSPQASGLLSFGARTGAPERLDGAIDDFRIYDRKLSAAEIFELFGMVAWYKLDETSGTVATDSTGLGNDGTFTGSPTLNVSANGAASQGTAVAFSGANYMQATGLYDKSSSVSAAAWVRLDGVDSLGAEVISLGDCFLLRLNGSSAGAQVKYYNGSTWVTATASQMVLNTGWNHFAAVLDSGATLKLYVNGVEAASAATSGAISYGGQGANTRIASHGNGLTTADLAGRIDDVRVFNRSMKPEEVFQLYRGSRINGVKILQWVEAR